MLCGVADPVRHRALAGRSEDRLTKAVGRAGGPSPRTPEGDVGLERFRTGGPGDPKPPEGGIRARWRPTDRLPSGCLEHRPKPMAESGRGDTRDAPTEVEARTGPGTPRGRPKSNRRRPIGKPRTRWPKPKRRSVPAGTLQAASRSRPGAAAHADSGHGPLHDASPRAEPVETTFIVSPHPKARIDGCSARERCRARRPDVPECERALAVEPFRVPPKRSAGELDGHTARGPRSESSWYSVRLRRDGGAPVVRPAGSHLRRGGCKREPRCSNTSHVRQLSRPRRSAALTRTRRPAAERCPPGDVPPKQHASPRPARFVRSARRTCCGAAEAVPRPGWRHQALRRHEAAAPDEATPPRYGLACQPPFRKRRYLATCHKRDSKPKSEAASVTNPLEHAVPTPKRRGDEASDPHVTVYVHMRLETLS